MPWRWERKIFVDQVLVPARLMDLRQLGLERLVELEEILIGLDEWPGEDFFLREVKLSDTRIIHQSTLEVIVCLVLKAPVSSGALFRICRAFVSEDLKQQIRFDGIFLITF